VEARALSTTVSTFALAKPTHAHVSIATG
jgi:hypothetical protein